MKTSPTPAQPAQHTPGPWKVMPCPDNAGKHPYHDHRWIATNDATVERGHDPRSWGLSAGELICEMRDGPQANARLISAAPDLLAALGAAWDFVENVGPDDPDRTDKFFAVRAAVRAAIAKAGRP